MTKQHLLPMEDFPIVLEPEPGLELDERLISFHSYNPTTPYNSSARMYMFSSHLSQAPVLVKGEQNIWLSGLDHQLAENTFSCRVKNDSLVLGVVSRYNGETGNYAKGRTETIVFTYDTERNMLDMVKIPYYHTLHQYFGFEYKWTDALKDITRGDFLKRETVLADSPAVAEYGQYRPGVNANICLLPIPEVSEDGVVISKSLSERLAYKIYEKRIISCGADKIPLNLYGDDNNYKAFPEIGQLVNPDSVIMAVRPYDESYNQALLTKKALQRYDPEFDELFYVKGPGVREKINGHEVESGKIVDIVAYESPRYKRAMLTHTADDIVKYVNGYTKYHQDIVTTYNAIYDKYKKTYGEDTFGVSEQLHRQIVTSLGIANPNEEKLSYCYRRDSLDILRIEIVVEYTVVCKRGAKISDTNGSKGVIVAVIDNESMMEDVYGTKADICMDRGAVVSRMNMGRLYQFYFGAASRHVQHLIRNWIALERTYLPTSNLEAIPVEGRPEIRDLSTYSDAVIDVAYTIVLSFTYAFRTEQYERYAMITDRQSKEAILADCLANEVYFYCRISSKRRLYQVAYGIESSVLKPIRGPVKFTLNGKEYVTKKPVRIAPQYTIVLGKTADSFLSTASARTNHYGVGVGIPSSQKHMTPHKDVPVKIVSETEGRLYVSYAHPKFIAEILARANKEENKYIYDKILHTIRPTNIDVLIDRNEMPYGNNTPLTIAESVFKCAGTAIKYVPDNTPIG